MGIINKLFGPSEIEKLKEKRDVEGLVKKINYGFWGCSDVCEALGEVGDERAVAPLIEFLEKSEDKESREKAALALGQLGDERAVTSLVKVLEVHSTDAEVCIGIVTALGQIGNEKAIVALVNALSDLRSKSDPLALVVPTVGDFARIALVEIGEPSLGPLTNSLCRVALGNERVWVRRSAESAIKSIHDKALEDEKK